MTVTWVAAPPPPRVAYAIGRKSGSAVVRNRIRRRLRSAVRVEALSLGAGAYLLSADAEVALMPFDQLCRAVRDATTAARGCA